MRGDAELWNRVAELKAALKPFAELVDACPPRLQDGWPLFDAWSDYAGPVIGRPTVGDVRRAAKVLSEEYQ